VKIMKILIPLDGSPGAEAALLEAIQFLEQNNGARFVLVRAVDPTGQPAPGATGTPLADVNEAAEYLGSVAEQLREKGVSLVDRSVWYAPAGPAIVEAVRAAKPDLIVMTADRRNGAGHLIPGPVAGFVMHRTGMPLVLVPAENTWIFHRVSASISSIGSRNAASPDEPDALPRVEVPVPG